MHHWSYSAPSGLIVGQQQLLQRIHQKAGTEASIGPKKQRHTTIQGTSVKNMCWFQAFGFRSTPSWWGKQCQKPVGQGPFVVIYIDEVVLQLNPCVLPKEIERTWIAFTPNWANDYARGVLRKRLLAFGEQKPVEVASHWWLHLE